MVLSVSRAVEVAAFHVVSRFKVPTTNSNVTKQSSYVAVIPVSVFEVNIAPTTSCISSSEVPLPEASAPAHLPVVELYFKYLY